MRKQYLQKGIYECDITVQATYDVSVCNFSLMGQVKNNEAKVDNMVMKHEKWTSPLMLNLEQMESAQNGWYNPSQAYTVKHVSYPRLTAT